MTNMHGRIPPHSNEAEQALLGLILLDDTKTLMAKITFLTREDFYRDAHTHIFDAMHILKGRLEPINIITIKNELLAQGILDKIGGVEYLTEISYLSPTNGDAVSHARTISDKAIRRRTIQAGLRVVELGFSEKADAQQIADAAEQAVFGVTRIKPIGSTQIMLNDIFENIDTAYRDRGLATGIDTGFKDLNYITGGLQEGDLIVLASRPSQGKTSLAMGIGQNAVLKGKTVAVFSLEMSKTQFMQRMICAEGRVDTHRIRTGYLNDEDWGRISEAVSRLWDNNLYIDDTTNLTATELRSKCRRLQAEHGVDLVIVDYLQLLRSGTGSEHNRYEEITAITRDLKSLARELNVPIIALSQLSRAVERREDKRPVLSDLRESGSLESEADVVAFIYRPKHYEQREVVRWENTDENEDEIYNGSEEVEVIIAKHRNGPTGTVKLAFTPRFARFDNLPGPAQDETKN